MNPRFISIIAFAIAISFSGLTQADSSRQGACLTAAKDKKAPAPKPEKAGGKAEKSEGRAVITTYSSPLDPISLDSKGRPTSHVEMVPVMVDLSGVPADTSATKRQTGHVSTHVHMRLLAVENEE